MSFLVRQGTLADAGVVADFNAAMALETEHRRLDRDRLAAGVARVLADATKGLYLLAEQDGSVIGQMMITYEWSDWRNGDFWWIQSVYVRPESRGQGVFQHLYRHVEARAKADPEVCGLRLYVEQQNHAAQEVYLRLGMQRADYQMFEVDFVLAR